MLSRVTQGLVWCGRIEQCIYESLAFAGVQHQFLVAADCLFSGMLNAPHHEVRQGPSLERRRPLEQFLLLGGHTCFKSFLPRNCRGHHSITSSLSHCTAICRTCQVRTSRGPEPSTLATAGFDDRRRVEIRKSLSITVPLGVSGGDVCGSPGRFSDGSGASGTR